MVSLDNSKRKSYFGYYCGGVVGLFTAYPFLKMASGNRGTRKHLYLLKEAINKADTKIWKGPIHVPGSKYAFRCTVKSEKLNGNIYVGIPYPVTFMFHRDYSKMKEYKRIFTIDRFRGMDLPPNFTANQERDRLSPNFYHCVNYDRVKTDINGNIHTTYNVIYNDNGKEYNVAYRVKNDHVEFLAYTEGDVKETLDDEITDNNMDYYANVILSMTTLATFGSITTLAVNIILG